MKPIPTPKNVVHHLRAMHDRLNDGWVNVDDAWWTTEAAAIIERLVFQRDEAEAAQNTLKVERDEARRMLCKDEAIIRLQRNRVHRDSEEVVCIAKEISVERGWDCFKEDSND